MTLEEKRSFVKEYCDSRTCHGCPVGTLARARGEIRENGVAKCWYQKDVTESMLDARIKVIRAEQGLIESPVDKCAKEPTIISRSYKISRLNELCGDQAEVCPECPCRELAKNAGTGTLCCFEDMDDAMLDKYLEKFNNPAVLSGGGCSGHDAAPLTKSESVDNVHPQHYKLPNGMEVIDVEVAMFGREAVMNHCFCTAAEYILRHMQKNGVEDIKKAHWWLEKYIELEASK